MAIHIEGVAVFLHFPRTGGSWIRKQLELHFGEAKLTEVGHAHSIYNDLPDEVKGLPVIGGCRNPADWIASHFRYRDQISGWNDEANLDQHDRTCINRYVREVSQNHHDIMMQYANAYSEPADFVVRFEHLEADLGAVMHELLGYEPEFSKLGKVNSTRPDRLRGDVAAEFYQSNLNYAERYGYVSCNSPRYSWPDWSGWWKQVLQKHLVDRYRGQQVRMLEVGVCEGRGAVAAFESGLLDHPRSNYEGVDIWALNPESRAAANISQCGGSKWCLSIPELAERQLEDAEFDILLIDGDHTHEGCQHDLETYWPHLKPGGVMVVDDYGCDSVRSDHPGVRSAVNQFLAGHSFSDLNSGEFYQKVVTKG